MTISKNVKRFTFSVCSEHSCEPKGPCIGWSYTLASPGGYDGMICAAAAMLPVATVTVITLAAAIGCIIQLRQALLSLSLAVSHHTPLTLILTPDYDCCELLR